MWDAGVMRECEYCKGVGERDYTQYGNPTHTGVQPCHTCAGTGKRLVYLNALGKEDKEEAKKELQKDGWVFPLRSYIHSGVALAVGSGPMGYPFDCPWDSGQIGVVLVKKDRGFRTKKKAEKAAEQHVETWNQYLSGDVYGYMVKDKEGNELDSCWGFYGIEYVKAEGKRQAEWWRKQEGQVERMEKEAFAL